MSHKILLIEDDPLLIDIYSTKLKEKGHEVVIEISGDKALESALSETPDTILLDIVLPHQDGWAILKELKKHKVARDIPVVILSNLGQDEELEKGKELGAALYLLKAKHTPSEVVSELEKLWQALKSS
jgi:DNA-binding response OmpR family regulator